MLTQSEIDAIKAEAEKMFPVNMKTIWDIQTESGYSNFDTNAHERKLCEKILTEERQRAKVLLDALETIKEFTKSPHTIVTIEAALNTYNKNKPNDRE